MTCEIKISLSGENKAAMRKSIAAIMASKGFRRRTLAEFICEDGMQPEKAADILAAIYEQEKKHSSVTITTLLIRSNLVTAELRRNKYRSI